MARCEAQDERHQERVAAPCGQAMVQVAAIWQQVVIHGLLCRDMPLPASGVPDHRVERSTSPGWKVLGDVEEQSYVRTSCSG